MLVLFKDRILYNKDIDKSFLEDFNSRIVDEIDTLLQQEQSEQVEKGIILYNTGEGSDSKFNILNLQFIQEFLDGIKEFDNGDINITSTSILNKINDNDNIDQILAHYAQFTDSEFYKEICNKLIEIKNTNVNTNNFKINDFNENNFIDIEIEKLENTKKQLETDIQEIRKTINSIQIQLKDTITIKDDKIMKSYKKDPETKLNENHKKIEGLNKQISEIITNIYKSKQQQIKNKQTNQQLIKIRDCFKDIKDTLEK